MHLGSNRQEMVSIRRSLFQLIAYPVHLVLPVGRVGEAMTDEDLMHQLQNGSRAAVDPLVRRYHRQLMAYFYQLSSDYHLAQDLAQECLFRLVSHAARYRYPEPLRPWLYRIATNLWRDHLKSAAHRHSLSALPWDLAEDMAGTDPLPDEVVTRHILAQQALTILQALPPLYSEVLALRFCQSLTVSEIAKVLELPEGTVKSRIFLGLRLIRARMAEEVSVHERRTRV
jgi:RNA polymerase sigma factor (sigma-70 family)